MKYGLYRNEILEKEVNSLPKSFENIFAGFDTANEEIQNSKGWYLLEETKPDKKEWQSYKFDKYELQDNILKKIYIVEDIDLETYKNIKKEEIKESHIQATTLGFDCSEGFKLDCTKDDVNNWANNITLIDLGPNEPIYVRDFNNITHEISIETYKKLAVELGSHYRNLFGKKWVLQSQIDSLDNYEEVSEVRW